MKCPRPIRKQTLVLECFRPNHVLGIHAGTAEQVVGFAVSANDIGSSASSSKAAEKGWNR